MNANHDKLNLHFTKIPQKPCQICGQTAWLVSDKIFYLGEYENGIAIATIYGSYWFTTHANKSDTHMPQQQELPAANK